MAIEVRCGCGQSHVLPEGTRVRTWRCPDCGTRVPVRQPSSGGRNAALIAAIALPIIGLAVGAAWVGSRYFLPESRGYRPTPAESVDEKYRSAAEAFANRPAEAIEDEGDRAAIARTLSSFVAAVGAGDGPGAARAYNMRRLLAEVQSAGGRLPIRNRLEEEQAITGIRRGMEQELTSLGRNPTGRWSGIEIAQVHFFPDRGEAVAFSRIEVRSLQATVKFRFWLIKEGGEWLVFDFESLGAGIRQSRIMAAASRVSPGDQARFARAVAEFQRVTGAIAVDDFATGLEAVRSARSIAPPSTIQPTLDMMEALCLMGLGRFEESLATADRGLALQDDMPDLHKIRGIVLHLMGRSEEALVALDECLRRLGDDAEVHQFRGQALAALGRIDEANEAFRRGVGDGSAADAMNRLEVAATRLERGEVAEAGRLYVEACRISGELDDYRTARGALQNAGAHAEVHALAADRLERTPEDGEALEDRGLAALALGRFEEAEGDLRRRLEADPPPAYDVLDGHARALARLGRFEDALAAAGRLAGAFPDEPRTRGTRAFVLALSGQLEEALAEAAAALRARVWLRAEFESEPAFEPLWKTPAGQAALETAKARAEFLGGVHELEHEGDWEGVLGTAARRAAAAPEDADALFYQGRALRNLGRPAEAEKFFLAGLEADLESERSLYWTELAYTLAEAGRDEEALAWAEKLVASEGDEPGDGLYVRAWIRARAGADELAVADLMKLLEAGEEWAWDVDGDPVFRRVRAGPPLSTRLEEILEEEE